MVVARAVTVDGVYAFGVGCGVGDDVCCAFVVDRSPFGVGDDDDGGNCDFRGVAVD